MHILCTCGYLCIMSGTEFVGMYTMGVGIFLSDWAEVWDFSKSCVGLALGIETGWREDTGPEQRTEIYTYTCIELRARFSLSILKAWCLPLKLKLAIGHIEKLMCTSRN